MRLSDARNRTVHRFRPALVGALLLAVLTAVPGALSAQAVRGVLRSADDGAPIAGAFVVLLDERGQPRGSALSGAEGGYWLPAPVPGEYRVRVDRIGYESFVSDAVRLGADAPVTLPLRIPVAPIALSDVRIEGRARCSILPDEGLAIHTAWEEARKALEATSWTGRQQYYRFDAVLFERLLDRTGRPVEEAEFEEVRYYGRHPFRSIPSRDLKLGGYVQTTAGRVDYYGPDASVLLSDDFLGTHCFRLDRSVPEGMLGLAFEPVDPEGPPDIAGLLRLDAETSELRSLDFRYTGLSLPVSEDGVGGHVEFARLPSGAWIVRRWAIRTPVIRFRERPTLAGRRETRPVLEGFDEGGGQVTAVYVTSRLIGHVAEDTLPVTPPPDSLLVRFPVAGASGR